MRDCEQGCDTPEASFGLAVHSVRQIIEAQEPCADRMMIASREAQVLVGS
jgi:hypothetical protein